VKHSAACAGSACGRLWKSILAILLAGGTITACSIEPITSAEEVQSTATSTAELPLASLLPTIEAAPSATREITPTTTSGPRLPVGIGERIFHDSLDDNGSGWPLTQSNQQSTAFSSGVFLFTVSAPYTTLISTLPQSFPNDLYIEVTVHTALCGEGVDTFGIVFRAQRDQSYRYAVTCKGELRLERYAGESYVNPSMWQKAPGWLQGAPADNRIGVLARGNAFQFFVDGTEIYSTHDPVITTGGIGLFVRTEKSTMLSVGFDELSAYDLLPPLEK
jgi:hypothetical protein